MLTAVPVLAENASPNVVKATVLATKPKCILVPPELTQARRYVLGYLEQCPPFDVTYLGWPDRLDTLTEVDYIAPLRGTQYHFVDIDPSGVTAYEMFNWFHAYYPGMGINQFRMLPEGIKFSSTKRTDTHVFLIHNCAMGPWEYFTETIIDNRQTTQTLYKFDPKQSRQTFQEMLKAVARMASLHCRDLNGDDTLPLVNLLTGTLRIQAGLD